MKLASLKNNTRDGQLIVVSKDLTKAVAIPHIAATMQDAIDNWQALEPVLDAIYKALNEGRAKEAFAFEPDNCLSPLPRAYHWADGSAYVNHVELVRKARGAEMPESFWTDPLMYQGGSDTFLAPTQDIVMPTTDWGVDFEAEVAVITDDVAMSVNKDDALSHIKLLMLVNDVSLRNLIPGELAKGFGFYQSKPSSSFSPVAVTPDELGESWQTGKVHLPMLCHFNDELFGQPNAGVDMTFNFGELVAHAAKSRPLCAGTIIGSGTISNYDRSLGSCCIAEKRMLETINEGEAKTAFMQFGDNIKISMKDKSGADIFGVIDQTLTQYQVA
ncbi:fumarylacetoacetate hydrolase family protein [Catenovulum sp. SM1970]|uniref:fumarylacetoacetate hydrolase family protein n=1 Tax=Marinifaba aquimaris TaxID=2741323 RepID=UPI0015743EB9|nr:fumarylacetoacetate hydrolase family protein [Marinifaba aquimaris]NTS78803.1 fumarylacetoacetate hydrolase family protein [Marinifaba aquimaris]